MAVRLASPVMVGRGGQLALLEQAFDRARAGSPSVVLLGGEAGAGKTRLITEFGNRLAGQAMVLSGGCVDLGSCGLAFAPFTAALRSLLRQIGARGVTSLVPGALPAELGRLLPVLGGGRSPGSGSGHDAGMARARLFEELLGLLENLADQQPAVLVIEDAHWADRSSRELVSFLARNLRAPAALLMLVSYRTDDLGRAHPLRPLLAELERLPLVQRMELPRLSRQEVIAQARGILGGLGLAGLIEEVVQRADGIPLFVEMLLESGGRLPESLTDLLLARTGQLPEATQRVLGAAAVAGAWSGQGLLEAATGLGEAALSESLRPAVATGVLVTGDEGYAFRHALIREAVLGGQLPGERSRWHARLAEALQASPELAPGGRAAAEIAHHWHAAGQEARALPAAWRAAADAAAALAYAEQLALLDRVLELWDAVPDAAVLTGASRLEVLEQAVTAAYLACEPERGIGLADAALAEMSGQADPVRAFFAHERRSAMSLQLGCADLSGLAAVASKVGDDDPAQPRVLAALAEQLMDAQQPDEAHECAERALANARRHRDLIAEAGALVTVAALAARRGELASQLPRLAEAQAIAEQANDQQLLMRALRCEASLLEAYGEHERAAAAARRGLTAAAAAGLARTYGAAHAAQLAEALTAVGRWDEALEVVDRALSLLPAAGTRLQLLRLAGLIGLARGDLDGAAAALHDTREDTPAAGDGSFAAFQALLLAELEISLLAAQGDSAAALATAARALAAASGRTFGLKRFLWPVLSATAHVASTAKGPGAPAQLTVLAQDVLRQAAQHAASAPPVSPLGRAHAAAYQAAAGQAAGQDDSGAWDSVASAWEQLGEPYRRAQALLHAAGAALAQGEDRGGVSERLRRAAALAEALGAGPLRDEVSSLARRARLDIAREDAAGDVEGPASLGLTGRELEVLRLVAAGRNNRDIATELFISAKTASVHVSNILAKLGVHSRVEAAAIAHRAGLTSAASPA